MPGSPTLPVTGASSGPSIDQERIHLGQEVVNAVADGKVAAAGIDRYLSTLAPAKERV